MLSVDKCEIEGKVIHRFSGEDGRPYWSVHELAVAVGYSNGSGLAFRIKAGGAKRGEDYSTVGSPVVGQMAEHLEFMSPSAGRSLVVHEEGLRCAIGHYCGEEGDAKHDDRASFLLCVLDWSSGETCEQTHLDAERSAAMSLLECVCLSEEDFALDRQRLRRLTRAIGNVGSVVDCFEADGGSIDFNVGSRFPPPVPMLFDFCDIEEVVA